MNEQRANPLGPAISPTPPTPKQEEGRKGQTDHFLAGETEVGGGRTSTYPALPHPRGREDRGEPGEGRGVRAETADPSQGSTPETRTVGTRGPGRGGSPSPRDRQRLPVTRLALELKNLPHQRRKETPGTGKKLMQTDEQQRLPQVRAERSPGAPEPRTQPPAPRPGTFGAACPGRRCAGPGCAGPGCGCGACGPGFESGCGCASGAGSPCRALGKAGGG